jgi:hypothetical protein
MPGHDKVRVEPLWAFGYSQAADRRITATSSTRIAAVGALRYETAVHSPY